MSKQEQSIEIQNKEALTLGDVRQCVCKVPEPRMKNSENGIDTYCCKCARGL